jgi:nucleotide-binding universal stress UspA family protein
MFSNARSYVVKFEKIMVPMAKGQQSRLPLEIAFYLAGKYSGEITALTVKEEMKELTWSDKVRIITNAYEDGKERNIKVVPRVRTARNIKTGIVDELKEKNYDLVLMGTHRRSGLSGSTFGTIGDYVIKNSTTPVVVFSIKRNELPYRNILLPVSETINNRMAVSFALHLMKSSNASLTLLDLRKFDEKKTHGFQHLFDNLGEIHTRFGEGITVVRGGDGGTITNQINGAIKEYSADLLVLGLRFAQDRKIRVNSTLKALIKESPIDTAVLRK